MSATAATAASTVAASTVALLIKEAIANMPDNLNTKKEIDEYYKVAMKEINDKMKEEKKALKKAEPKSPKVPKEPKEPKKRVKKAAKPTEVDEDGNEIVKVKKPLNNYQKFIQEQRPKVKEDYPDLSGEEIFTKIAELWKQHKEDIADNKSDENEIKKIDEDIKKIDEEIKKIDSDGDADEDAASDEADKASESEASDASDADDASVVVSIVAPVAVVEDKKQNPSGGKAPPSGGKAPRKALGVAMPAKPAKPTTKK